MKVQELMTGDPLSCAASTNLAEAVKLMWDGDCGVIPVTDETRRVVGMITDRDICIALATRNLLATQVNAGEVASATVYRCRPEDDVLTVLQVMKDHRVRRLPVVDTEERLVGVLSINDVVLATGGPKGLNANAVIDTFKGICAHQLPQAPVRTAA
jgi:CBS domain-containing protein